ncbi:MAG: MotA/TolQ/ExbB proton channel family protein [Phycisphaerales bacterium]|nr:MotA/TolQ/ExbB proton channel family protein [Phycisphaerales bacterium]
MSTQRLSLTRSDPERWVGLRSGRFTRPTQVLSLVLGGALTGLFYLLLSFARDSTANAWFTDQGTIPYFIVFFTGWSLAYLLLKWAKIIAQRRALRAALVPEDPAFVLTPATADAVMNHMYQVTEEPRSYLVFNRVWAALSSMRNFGRLGDLEDLLQSQADNDEAVSQSSYTIVRGLVWAIPVLGFIGTVIGLSLAIGEFGNVLESAAGTDDMKAQLSKVTSGLGLAFITTLEALVAALGIHLLLTMIHREEEQFLDDCREYCQSQLVSRVRITTPDWAPTPA